VLLKTEKLDGSAGEKFTDVDYQLPADLTNKDLLTVKFVAHPGATAGGVYYVRLMKN
jgi:hypothetical protein